MNAVEHGYTARWSGIRQRAQDAAEEAEHVRMIRDEVRDAFARAGRPMGDDQYGAQLEQSFPYRKAEIMAHFEGYLDDLEGVHDRLHDGARTYRDAESPGG
ncbi:hypothetical protein ABT294_20180 [Nonomuraea sp. NPDC000554]|uniref:hypothetical protein n=1 Tax=Nonomuraea sp. NPDC000554 TaxID=3154259 RepID=UPI00332975A2